MSGQRHILHWFVDLISGVPGKIPAEGTKRYPSIPKATWRRAAATFFAIGVVVAGGVALAIGVEAGRTIGVALVGGIASFVIGMLAFETWWLRAELRREHFESPSQPPAR